MGVSALLAAQILDASATGRSVITGADASAIRTTLGLGTSATLNAGSANGVATLDSLGKLAAAQIPDISLISYLGSVASQAAMLALTGQQGDWCVRSDLSTTWVITGSDPTLIANWTQLSYPSVPVQSVFGRTGNVVGVSTDYSSVGITNTAIGASNPSTGAFTTLSANSATLSAGTLNGTVLDITQTWGGTGTYTGLKYNVTDSGPSNAASLLMDLQVGGSSMLNLLKQGRLTVAEQIIAGTAYAITTKRWGVTGSTGHVTHAFDASVGWSSTTNINIDSPGDTRIFRDAAGTLAQRNSTNAQAFRVYNTTDAGLTNYERAKIAWESNVLRIGTEKAGTGSARALELQTDGKTGLILDSTTGANGFRIKNFGSQNVTGIWDASLTPSTSNYALAINETLTIVNAPTIVYFRVNGSTIASIDNTNFNANVFNGTNYSTFRYSGSVVQWSFASGPTYRNLFNRSDTGTIVSASTAVYGWASTADLGYAGVNDTGIGRASAGVVEVNNGTIGTLRDLKLRTIELVDGNLVLGTTTGTKIGTATTQKLAFWNATPDVQPTTAVAAATLVGGGGAALTDTDTFDGYTIKQIVKALRNIGLLA